MKKLSNHPIEVAKRIELQPKTLEEIRKSKRRDDSPMGHPDERRRRRNKIKRLRQKGVIA